MQEHAPAPAGGTPPTVRAMRRIMILEDCARIDRMMHSPENIATILGLVESATAGKVSVVSHVVEIFPNNAFTLLAVLSASSLDIHCWPECGLVDLMVYMCQGYDDGSDNGPCAERLCSRYVDYFAARRTEGPFLVPGGPHPRKS